MKRVDTSNIIRFVRQLGANKQVFDHFQNAYTEVFTDLINGLLVTPGSPTILTGCINSGAGANYNISAGSVFYNGLMYRVPAFVGVAPGGQVPVMNIATTYTADDPIRYSDTNYFNTLVIDTMQFSFAASGSGVCDFGNLFTIKNRLNSSLLDVPGQLAALVNSAPSTLDTLKELADALGDDPNFATTITTLIGTKANKTQTGWTNFALLNGWANFFGNAKYRVDEFGKVHISANLNAAAATSDIFANLPAGIIPTDDLIMNITAFTGAAQTQAILVVNSSGNIQINNKNTAYRYKIHGVSYWTDES